MKRINFLFLSAIVLAGCGKPSEKKRAPHEVGTPESTAAPIPQEVHTGEAYPIPQPSPDPSPVVPLPSPEEIGTAPDSLLECYKNPSWVGGYYNCKILEKESAPQQSGLALFEVQYDFNCEWPLIHNFIFATYVSETLIRKGTGLAAKLIGKGPLVIKDLLPSMTYGGIVGPNCGIFVKDVKVKSWAGSF